MIGKLTAGAVLMANLILLLPQPEVIEAPVYFQPVFLLTEEAIVSDAEEEILTNEIVLPENQNNGFKTYMDYRAITDKSSKQYKLQLQAHTDEYGMRKVGDYYCVALGTAFSKKIGDKFIITLEDGQVFKAILADQKANVHTDETNKYVELGGGRINIIEFIVDVPKLENTAKIMGDVSHISHGSFSGKIMKIEKECGDETDLSN